jgi:uncharacterized repeat protein (TIGR01451 family)
MSSRLAALALSACVAATAAILAAPGSGILAQGPGGASALTIGVDVVGGSAARISSTGVQVPPRAIYRIEVANRGTAAATGVTVSNPIPTDTRFAASDRPPAPGDGGASPCVSGENGKTCRWAIGSLQPGERATIDVTYTLEAIGMITNGVTATADGGVAASDSDASLRRMDVSGWGADTYIDRAAPVGTTNGSCPALRVRRDDSVTAFVRVFPETEGFPAIDRLWAAELHATVASAPDAAAGDSRIGAHRVISGPWRAQGGCPATTTQGARTGAAPASSSASTDEVVAPAGARVVWDLTADLDTAAERESHGGWELIDEGSSPATAQTVLHSLEASAGTPAQLVFLVTTPEQPACVELAPRALTATAADEAVLTARLTDGQEAQQTDFCNGAGVAGAAVDWEIEDDSPDAYFSSRNGEATLSRQNVLASVTGADGYTNAGVRLVTPEYGTGILPESPNRVAARIARTSPASSTEQDATVAWSRGSAPPEAGETPLEPQARTEPASAVRPFAATLHGVVNPMGEDGTNYYFEYGRTAEYGRSIPSSAGVPLGAADTEEHAVAQTPIDLAPNETYHYRVVAVSPAGWATGADQTFTTAPAPEGPSAVAVETRPASEVGPTQATLHGVVDPNGEPGTRYYFEYGTDETYGQVAPSSAGVAVAADDAPRPVAQDVVGLTPGTTYHYRVVAVSSRGRTTGEDRTFTTLTGLAERTLKVSAGRRTVRWGEPVGIAGRVSSPLAACERGQPVQLWRRYPGERWRRLQRVRTSKRGRFRFDQPVARTARYLVVVQGTAVCTGTSSRPIKVRSRPILELQATPLRVPQGARVSFSGRLVPRVPSSTLVLERRVGSEWVAAREGRLGRRSRYRFVFDPRWRGEQTLRTRWPGGHGHTAATSARVTVLFLPR